jgi:hypothetical protein
MNLTFQSAGRFFRIMGSGQAYVNLIYLFVAFPFGILYFVFLVSGLALGFSLTIIWVGVPILLLVAIGWWTLANFERLMAIHLLKEKIPPMAYPSKDGADIMLRIKEHLTHSVTWKSLLFLILKFPLGIATFVVLITLVSLTLAFLAMPFTHPFTDVFPGAISFGTALPAWRIDSVGDALLSTLIGLILWPVTLHLTNALAWVHARLAKVMLSADPGSNRARPV